MKRRTKRRLIIKICVLVVIAIIAIIVVVRIANRNVVTYKDGQTYKVKVRVPEYDNDMGTGYRYVKNDENNTNREIKNSFTDFAIIGENVNIEFQEKLYTFQNTTEYIKKYGYEDANFANFKKYVSDEEINGTVYSNVKETTINGKEAIQYTYNNSIVIVLNTDNIDEKSYVAIRIYPRNEEDDVNSIIEDEKLQEILNTVKFSKN